MAKKIALVLSGCGVFDGSEIHEAVLSLYFLSKHKYDIQFLAPNIEQAHVINHLEGKPAEGEKRNVLVESARIARGKIKDIATVSAAEFDGLFFPGGFGAAKNLCTFAFDGSDAKVNADVAKLIRDMNDARKPVCFLCISPAVCAKVIGNGVELTIGNDKDTAAALEKMGAKHINKPVEQSHVDIQKRVVSAPAYMYDKPIVEVAAGIESAVTEFAKLVG